MNKKKLSVGSEGHLNDLVIGQKAVVLALHNDNKALRRRLLDMGITKGVIIEVKKKAPMGDPVDIYLRGYELCIRESETKNIDIRVVE
ncbi:MAG TPA: FeoA family protein [Bacilli bacterium]|jgi:Fe2+ transport system protein FeoA|nr:ferrous iron transport protein A [Bacilli bacterium]NLT01765.1 ferrous iron transport protein A [Acholeplasmataceae bacterium]HNZ77278.1 FeoA family protein [Bacilli bacterium]HOD60621.1 FeoA family protein [Bacilli bacterium]HOH60986.1 FeoA family protein [Bacilli bacterium]